uniref:Uncharacterized protein n=1 Tax=Branchiostoma floridae TaxID=7739 RepID=C3ZLX8_BRAFL|eukprot:XP_002590448.1 hypothetical protein BRAFLDRAFT_86337 [Branchiostoma floridae]
MASKTEDGDMMSPCPETYLTPPPQPNVKKHGQLTDEQLKLFYDEGFVVVRDFFTPEELQPVRDAIAYLMDDLADRMFQAGLIKNKHENANLFERLILLEKEYPGISVILHKTPKLPQGFRDLWAHDRLLNVMEQLVGPEIAGHPNWNLRPKTPQNQQMDVPWHQDNAYFAPELLGTFVGTAWIPFLDVNAGNGCMQMVKYGHRKGVTAKHVCCMGGTCDDEAPEDVSFTKSRQVALQAMKEAIKETKKSEDAAKEKRKKKDELFKQQKKQKIQPLPLDVLKEVEAARTRELEMKTQLKQQKLETKASQAVKRRKIKPARAV